MKVIKKIITIVIVAVQLLLVSNNTKAANVGEVKGLERAERGYYCVQKWDGSKWVYLTYNRTYYTDTNGQKYVAYCLSPGLPGVGYVSGEKETYQVKVKETLDNDIVWRIMKNGYPYKSIEELGVETIDDAYFATMQAVNCVLRGYTLEQAKGLYSPGKFAINGESLEDIQRRGNKTLNAMYNLLDIGLNGTETRGQLLNISVKSISEFKKENDDFYSQIFTVQSSSEISEYSVTKVENLPEGSYISDMAGNKKDSFKNRENFKIMIPKNKILNDIKGKISIKAKQKNYPIYYSSSMIEGFQDYALCNNEYSEVYANLDISVQANKSTLVINKVDDETQKPIKGVKFKITNTVGKTDTFITDENGKITLTNQNPGTVVVKEIEAVENYKINQEEIKVSLGYNETKEIKIENELKKGSIKIVKTDKDNENIKLKDVKFQLVNENNNVVKEGATDENGELIFDNLVIGKYKIIEMETVGNYKKNEKEIDVEVKYNQTAEVKIENELKKGKIKIIKVDQDNKEIKLENVMFRLLDENDNIVKEGVTDKNGELVFENILIGIYKIVEVETNEKYQISDEEIIIELNEDEIKEVVIENKKIKEKEEVKDIEESKVPEKIEIEKELPKTGNIKNEQTKIINIFVTSLCTLFIAIRKLFKM